MMTQLANSMMMMVIAGLMVVVQLVGRAVE
jgi:hypothetical protein